MCNLLCLLDKCVIKDPLLSDILGYKGCRRINRTNVKGKCVYCDFKPKLCPKKLHHTYKNTLWKVL